VHSLPHHVATIHILYVLEIALIHNGTYAVIIIRTIRGVHHIKFIIEMKAYNILNFALNENISPNNLHVVLV